MESEIATSPHSAYPAAVFHFTDLKLYHYVVFSRLATTWNFCLEVGPVLEFTSTALTLIGMSSEKKKTAHI